MVSFSEKSCVPCEGGIPPLTKDQIDDLIPNIDEGWQVVDGHHLEKIWDFPDFNSALEFVNNAGAICEDEGHHADFELGWGRVCAMIWTHKIDGLTESDFILAAKFDYI